MDELLADRHGINSVCGSRWDLGAKTATFLAFRRLMSGETTEVQRRIYGHATRIKTLHIRIFLPARPYFLLCPVKLRGGRSEDVAPHGKSRRDRDYSRPDGSSLFEFRLQPLDLQFVSGRGGVIQSDADAQDRTFPRAGRQ